MTISNFFPLSGCEINYINWFSNGKPICLPIIKLDLEIVKKNKSIWVLWESGSLTDFRACDRGAGSSGLCPEDRCAGKCCFLPFHLLGPELVGSVLTLSIPLATTLGASPQHCLRNCPGPSPQSSSCSTLRGQHRMAWAPPRQFPLSESGPYVSVSVTIMAGSCSRPARGNSCPSVPHSNHDPTTTGGCVSPTGDTLVAPRPGDQGASCSWTDPMGHLPHKVTFSDEEM